ncbi:C4-dicarboxylate transporter DctM subunit [Rhodoligotrophos appendicifer]|uniref:TRAP transporter large permease n=1 Tax=Rhodoligotrophos appendicifer TaxID=987056 RepID=UPI00117E2BE3|nr:TRAP transporter large permease [Rhodoligotrophos appendicifer]
MTIAIGVIVFFLICLACSVPVFVAMGVSALLGNYLLGGSNLLQDAALGAYNALNSFVLLAVPLYILAGTLLQQTGLSDRLFAFAASLVSGIRGGLGVATVIACAIFAAISGSSVATAATIGLVAIPVLTRNGYPLARSGGLIAGGGTLGILIPPSIALLLYGVLTDQSIGALFVAGVIPGVMLALIMAVYTIFMNPRDPDAKQASVKDILKATLDAGAILLLPILIFAGIYTGVATATEVAALAVVYTVMVGLVTRTLGWQQFVKAGLAATHASVMILMLVAFGALMTHFLTVTRVPQALTEVIAGSGLGFFGVLTVMVVFYLILGMFLEALSMMLITIPILYPVAMAAGIHPLAFGIFVVLAIEVAQITPPVGINLFTVSQIGKIPFESMAKAIIPYVVMMILMMYAVAYWQDLATWLPQTMDYGR